MKTQKQQWGVEDYFPEEIVDKILLKLPVKEVIRCSAVCKLWNSLIKNPTFIQTHLKNQTHDGVSELLLLSSDQSDDLHWDNPAALFGQYSNLRNPIHNDDDSSNWTKGISYQVVGTCNGLVCLSLYSFDRDPCPPVILWNPSIRKFGFLPSPSLATDCCRNESYYFCYDSRIDDYKVVRIVERIHREVEVWSLASGGAWKSLNNVPADFSPYRHCHAFVNGAFHWVQSRPTKEEEEEEFAVSVVALDMVDESFRNVEIRQGWSGPPMISRYHGDGDQCWLALFELQGDSCFDLWVMKEYGVAESWTKLFNVRLLGSPEEELRIEPFGFTKSGQVVVRMGRDEEFNSFKSYDPEDKQFRDFGNQAYDYYFMDSFVESLVLLGQTNVFSY
ncbi:putative F-box domain-containing protein [Rosa chinensis]|uniref:Putative F-box domain-containing protein n=1 Tax=Rosa chinensis TaxID=74649 RepID=A0A2P6RR92_ROSCH|nr:F-box/kelch-repeat protein At3g23880 [Rosa chinensis]XP_024184403.1 F-box/kelch-repeat protein At3g23880 [Rosa chinensis]XP_024184404.1 F-box/kelch-repeat protein At3g23880 [Rosa chinensis]XP_040370868.1 F-box/kelch-repeat protein At3g23880 [Rosa chinensis]XP_040370869.1 F-box/kelch-repeat protein At3g23880 [Rosa chinensis]XP_040370870.1 F-box/kelch-repeat protein At3g23880 [Rosa chinensis]XP_040370871.1 F-box/kelch-repeat protein At3g23880 [Rosa chinensis]XP_040370872.1 F-box/kelch-repea